MHKAYIILAHKDPEQVFRLVSRLDDNESVFFVHIDKKGPAKLFDNLSAFGTKIRMINPEVINWAGFGMVRAIINGFRLIKSSGLEFGSINLLSGQDYPIKSNAFINQYLEENKNKNFIEYCSMPNNARWKPNGGMYRIEKYFFGMGLFRRLASRSINFLGIIVPFLRRKPAIDKVPYGGSSWWTINHFAMNYILDFIDRNPAYLSFHKYSFAADEVFFHTILLNAEEDFIKRSIVNNNLRYMHWPDTSIPHPEILLASDIEKLKSTEALFARKFDINVDCGILDLIDKLCLR